MANVELGSSNLKEVYDAINSNGSVDTSNLAKLNEANTFTGLNTFTALPQSEATPTDAKDLTTKKYVDDTANNKVSKTGPETIEGVKTFSSIPLCSQRPTNGSQLANKDYVDSVATGGDISNFAKLDAENIFTALNTFSRAKFSFIEDGINVSCNSSSNGSILISSSNSNGISLNSYSTGNIVIQNSSSGNINMSTFEGDVHINTGAGGDININANEGGVAISSYNIGAARAGDVTLTTGSPANVDCGNIIIRSGSDLEINVGTTGVLNMNSRTKAEFQRVLEVPTTTGLIDQSTNQSINSTKTFTVPPVSTTSPTAGNHITNKSYVDTVGNSKVALSGNQTIAGNKTFSGATTTAALTANGNTALNGNTTFKLIPNCAVKPTGNNHLANKLYVDNLGGVITSGAAIDFRKGNHFLIKLTANAQISVANWGGIAGKSGTITITGANYITGFKAPFNFRVTQSGFTGTEVFSYYCYSSGLIRIVRS